MQVISDPISRAVNDQSAAEALRKSVSVVPAAKRLYNSQRRSSSLKISELDEHLIRNFSIGRRDGGGWDRSWRNLELISAVAGLVKVDMRMRAEQVLFSKLPFRVPPGGFSAKPSGCILSWMVRGDEVKWCRHRLLFANTSICTKLDNFNRMQCMHAWQRQICTCIA